jgi:type IV secretion system protein VirB10
MSADDRDLRPSVALPRDALPLPVLVAIMAVLALGLFLLLDGQRRAKQIAPASASAKQATLAAAPPLALPSEPLPEPPAPPIMLPAPAPRPVPAPQPIVRYLPAPTPVPLIGEAPPTLPLGRAAPSRPNSSGTSALVIDLTQGAGATIARNDTGTPPSAVDDTARATLIRNRAAIIPQGTILAAVLETPLNSDRPGLARALVAQDVRGFDGARVLIPRGSRLMGEFRADNAAGKRRVLVTWNRLIRPDGVAIRLASPATDAMGGAGIAGSVDTHFAERFASAVLQSALNIGVNVASAELGRSGGSVYVGVPSQFSGLGQQLLPTTNRPATVKTREGAQIAVLVARDLDFSGTPVVR